MTHAVIGAKGQIGQLLTAELLTRGFTARTLEYFKSSLSRRR